MKNVAFAVVALGLVACNSSPRVIDSGINLGGDTGAPGHDSGTAVMADTNASTCAPQMGTAPTAPVCAHATLTCLMAATSATAQQACITNDPMAMNCNTCLNEDVVASCTSRGSCAQAFGNVNCCLMTACPTGADACVTSALDTGGACDAQATAFGNCTDSEQMAMHCGVSTVCFNAT